MNVDQVTMAWRAADDRLVSSLLPGNKSLEVEERFRKMLAEGKLDERRIEVSDSHWRTKTMTVKEVRELLYKEECAKSKN